MSNQVNKGQVGKFLKCKTWIYESVSFNFVIQELVNNTRYDNFYFYFLNWIYWGAIGSQNQCVRVWFQLGLGLGPGLGLELQLGP